MLLLISRLTAHVAQMTTRTVLCTCTYMQSTALQGSEVRVMTGQRHENAASYDRPHAATADFMTSCASSVSGCQAGCSCS